MSSSRPTRRARRPLTLRTKLVVSIIGLIVVVSAGIGVITELVLSGYLMHQLDAKVTGPGPRVTGGAPGGTKDATRITQQLGCGQDEFRPNDNSIAAIVGQTGTSSGIVRVGRACQALTADQLAQLKAATPADDQPVTMTLDGVEYRVAARALPDGNVFINGASTADVTAIEVRLAIIMASVAGGAILLGGAAVFLIVRRSVRPLERVAATARAVAELPLDRGEVDLTVRVPDADTDARTEIGQVGSALNQMLGHVSSALQARHSSEQRVRQFVADASHELRTPLAAIRGYSELARRSREDPPTVAHALRRVESESERMTALVEDLLLLARLDSGRPLESREVDLTALVVDRVSDARVAGPDHRWLLQLPDEPVMVAGDPARLHQVVANLLSNARTHTPPGTEVVTALADEGGSVLLSVTDNGPGIPADLQAEVFGRFVRGDSSRSRAAGSTGLGLAIVAAVVSAHSGQVSVHSTPGHTSVRVVLPTVQGEFGPGSGRTPSMGQQSGDAQTLPASDGPRAGQPGGHLR